MKKIAIVANSTWNIYNFRINLIRKFRLQGYRVIVIAPIDEYIHYLNESHFTKHIPLTNLSPQSKNPLKDLRLIYELYKIYKEEKPDLVLHYTIKPNIYGSIAARWAGISCMSTVTGLGYTFLNHGVYTRVAKFLYKYAFKSNFKTIFHNHDDQRLFKKFNLIPDEISTVIKGSGVDTKFFRPVRNKKDNDKFVFLFVGRLLYDKGIVEYIQAALKVKPIIKNAECWVVGEMNAKNPSNISKKKLLQWVENRYIRYWGATNDIRNFIKNVDVIVLPSYREGMPRAVLEGMAMGKPIITTNTSGCREAVEDNINGYLIPIRDSISLAEAMVKIYHLDEDKFRKMGEESRNKVLNEFDEKIITQNYLDLAQELFQEKNEADQISKIKKLLD
ncbi:MAG: glycosyltransferase family 4 protein [Saprospiraceae bacterium]